MKILAIMGSPRKGQTYRAVSMFEKHLKSHVDLEFEYVFLKDFNLAICRGCGLCLERGKEFCPLKDDRDIILKKMMEADGIIFASPNYSLQVTAIMKNFLDRLAFIFHRPRFFHKAMISIVTQGVYGGDDIVKYFESVGKFWGFNVCKGINLTTPWGVVNPSKEWPKAESEKIDIKIKQAAERFYAKLIGNKSPEPDLKMFAIFHLARSGHKYTSDRQHDYAYFKEKGWFESSYYYETGISWYKMLIGAFIDYKLKPKQKIES